MHAPKKHNELPNHTKTMRRLVQLQDVLFTRITITSSHFFCSSPSIMPVPPAVAAGESLIFANLSSH